MRLGGPCRVGVFAAFVCAALGCGLPGTGATTGEAVDPVVRYAEELCAAHFACGCDHVPFDSIDACVAQELVAVGEPEGEWNQACADRRVREVERRCGVVEDTLPRETEVCLAQHCSLYTLGMAEGEYCGEWFSEPFDPPPTVSSCADGLLCDGSCTQFCVLTPPGDGCRRIGRFLPLFCPEGTSCLGDQKSGYQCWPPDKYYAQEGENCHVEGVYCASGLDCVDGVCRGPSPLGGSCGDGIGCAQSWCDDGVCVAPFGPGAACEKYWQCDGFCDGGACAPHRADGSPCGEFHECESGRCIDGVCSQPLSVGEECVGSGWNCASGYCDPVSSRCSDASSQCRDFSQACVDSDALGCRPP